MNPFDYLSVLLSIVLGLAIANVLSALAGLMHARERINFYWPPVAWALTLFFVAVQHWWAQWGERNTHEWTFVAFFLAVLMPVNMYLLSSLVLPSPQSAERVDLYAWYERNRTWFFSVATCLPLLSIAEELIRSGHMASVLNFGFQLVFAALTFTAIFLKSRRASEWLTAIIIVLIGAYIGLLYLHLSA